MFPSHFCLTHWRWCSCSFVWSYLIFHGNDRLNQSQLEHVRFLLLLCYYFSFYVTLPLIFFFSMVSLSPFPSTDIASSVLIRLLLHHLQKEIFSFYEFINIMIIILLLSLLLLLWSLLLLDSSLDYIFNAFANSLTTLLLQILLPL